MISGVPVSTWVLRGVAALAPPAALVSGVPEGYVPPVWLVVLVLAGGVGYAMAPEHLVGWVLMIVVVGWWTWTLRGQMPVGALVASAALMAAHVSGLVLGYGPPRAAVARSIRATWLVRGSLVWLTAPLIWVVARGDSGRSTPSFYWTVGVAVSAVGAVLVAILFPVSGQDHPG